VLREMHLPAVRQNQIAILIVPVRGVKAIIYTSGVQRRVFTAGNDIAELIAPRTTIERYSKFWGNQNEFLARLYKTPLITVAAIRGACPAGGCAIAMMCDYRVMSTEGDGTIGLNEVALGIVPPKWWARVMVNLLGQQTASRFLMNATMLTPHEAVAVGLIDKAVSENDLVATARELIKPSLKVPGFPRAMTKATFRKDVADQWIAEIPDEIKSNWRLLHSPAIIKSLEGSLARLSKKPEAKL